jgi:hypothetical protein
MPPKGVDGAVKDVERRSWNVAHVAEQRRKKLAAEYDKLDAENSTSIQYNCTLYFAMR